MVAIKTKPQKEVKTSKIKKLKKIRKQRISPISVEKQTTTSTPETTTPVKKKVKKVCKYVMPSKAITEDVVNAALEALQQITIHCQKKNKIFEEEHPIFAEIHCIKIQNTRGNIKFVLPHSTVATTAEVCLITPDLKRGKKPDHEPTVEHWQEILDKSGVTSIKTILPMRQLRVEYDQFELKRRLLTQHDFIMVDTRVLNHVSHLLGKMFFKKHNMLVPVRIHETKNIKKDIEIGLHTAMLRVNEGATSTIIVGHTAMPQKSVKDNILSLIQQLDAKFPGGEPNIRSISLKLPLSLAIPLYITLRPNTAVRAPKLKHKKPKHFAVVEGELSTIPGSTVKVSPDGTVHLINSEQTSDTEDEKEDADDDDDAKKESEMDED